MKPLFIVCGLPRSGTTFAQSFLSESIEGILTWPDETHLLQSTELIDEFVSFHKKYFQKYLLQNPADGYSPYGTVNEYIENSLLAWASAQGAIDLRVHYGDTRDYNLKNHVEFINKTIYQIYNSSSHCFKKPTIEANHKKISEIFCNRQVIFLYCIRKVEDVYRSAVVDLKWFDNDFFLSLCQKSYESLFEMKANYGKRCIIFNIDNVHNSEYIKRKIQDISETHAELKLKNSFENKIINSAPHLKDGMSQILNVEELFKTPPFNTIKNYYEEILGFEKF